MSRKVEIFSLVSGIIFLVSSIAKSLDATMFSNTINSYDFGDLWFMAPIIILVELYMGLSLIFQQKLRLISLFSLLFLLGLTCLYIYGWLVKDITDCGCFGKLSILNTSPILTLVRNAILLFLCFETWRLSSKERINKKWLIGIVVIVSMSLCAFMSGYTLKGKKKSNKPKQEAVSIYDTQLPLFVSTSPDSTYWVFAFSYTCPHCMNSIENLKQYERVGVADRVIALAVENEQERESFKSKFLPNFEIKEFPIEEISKLTNTFPKSFFIENDSVKGSFSGELLSAHLLLDLMNLEPSNDSIMP